MWNNKDYYLMTVTFFNNINFIYNVAMPESEWNGKYSKTFKTYRGSYAGKGIYELARIYLNCKIGMLKQYSGGYYISINCPRTQQKIYDELK